MKKKILALMALLMISFNVIGAQAYLPDKFETYDGVNMENYLYTQNKSVVYDGSTFEQRIGLINLPSRYIERRLDIAIAITGTSDGASGYLKSDSLYEFTVNKYIPRNTKPSTAVADARTFMFYGESSRFPYVLVVEGS